MKGSSIYPLLLVNFVNALGYSIILPFLIFLVTRFGGTGYVYGVLAATYPAFQLVGAPVLGRWSDSQGRRKILLLSQAGTLASWLLFLAALYLPITRLLDGENVGVTITLPLLVLFVARAFDGLTGGNNSVANAYLADISRDEDRGRNFGRMAISGNLGYIVGPAAAGLLGSTSLGESLPVLGAALVSVVALLAIVFLLPESKPCVLEKMKRMPLGKVLGQELKDCVVEGERLSFAQVMRLPGIGFILLLYFLIFLGFNFFYTAFPVHAARGLGWKVTETGAFFSILSIMMVVVQGPVLSWASKRIPERTLIVGGNLILGINFLMLTSPDKTIIFAAAALFALGNGLMWPSVMAIVARVAGDRHQGAVQGIAGSVAGLASILGLIAGGVLYEQIHAGTFVVAAGIIFLVSALSLRLGRAAPPRVTAAIEEPAEPAPTGAA